MLILKFKKLCRSDLSLTKGIMRSSSDLIPVVNLMGKPTFTFAIKL